MKLLIHTIESRPFYENTYILHMSDQNGCLVFDPGFEPKLILEYLQEHSLNVSAILNTHGHSDHIAGNHSLKKAFPQAPLLIGEREAGMLIDAELNLSAKFGMPFVSPPADRTLSHGDKIEFAGILMEVRFTPGHSPGHIVFVIDQTDQTDGLKIVIGGDVLFRDSIGRTDFPNGSFNELAKSIRTQLYTLPDNTVVYPGHGPVTTIGYEKLNNEFVPFEVDE